MFWPANQTRSLPERLRPGERWELMAKVRQPFGTLNPESFDAEAWMLEQGFQFVGSVQSGKSAQTPRLLGIESGFGIRLDQLRDAIRYRIKQAVGDSSAAGVLSALVVGDQRAISLQDWTIFRRTGVSHLMSIKCQFNLRFSKNLFSSRRQWGGGLSDDVPTNVEPPTYIKDCFA